MPIRSLENSLAKSSENLLSSVGNIIPLIKNKSIFCYSDRRQKKVERMYWICDIKERKRERKCSNFANVGKHLQFDFLFLSFFSLVKHEQINNHV
jgi:hypothetical protein